jgi:Ca-activated chloride channel family protein
MMPQPSDPEFLWLALLVPPLLWWSLRRRRAALRHPAAGRLAGLPAGRAPLARWAAFVLTALGLLLPVAALARPRSPDLHTRVETEGVAIVLLVDVSGSMATPDFDWNGGIPITRLEAVKRSFKLFVKGGDAVGEAGAGADTAAFEGRPTDLIGLVAFATRPDTVSPLTLSHSALVRILEALKARRGPGESETNISDAVAVGLHRLQAAGARRKVLVLLTDGEHNVKKTASGWSPKQAAQVAASLKVPIYTIDAGGGASVPEEGVAAPDDSPAASRARAVETLRDVAAITGGRNFSARDTASLLTACRAIDGLERKPVESFQYRRHHEAYPWLSLAALGCWAVALGLERTFWRRFP